MAKGKIFIGEIMADMVSSLGSLEAAMDAQVLKMDDQIAELHNINTAVASDIDSVLVEYDDELNPIIFNDVEESGTAKHITKRYTCRAQGQLTFSGSAKSGTNGTESVKISTKINEGPDVLHETISSSTWKPFAYTVSVSIGDTLEIDVFFNHSTVVGYLAEGSKITYKVKDIVNEGALIPLV